MSPPATRPARSSAAPAGETLRLRLSLPDATGSLRRGALQPLLRSSGRRISKAIALLDTADGRLAAADWVCASEDAEPALLPVCGNLGMPPDIAGLGPLKILARGTASSIAAPMKLGIGGGGSAELGHVELQHGRRSTAAAFLSLTGPRAEILRLAHGLADEFGLVWDGAQPLVTLGQSLGLAPARPRRAGDFTYALPEAIASGPAIMAFAPMLRHCLQHFDGNIAAVRQARDSEGVHQMRVALRRLRSLLDLFAPLLPEALLADILPELRWLNGPLGRRRDLDVFAEETLQPLSTALPNARALRHVDLVLSTRREAAQKALLSLLHSARFARLRLSLELLACSDATALLETLAPAQRLLAEQPAPAYAASLLQHRRRRLRKLGRQLPDLSVPDLHRLRIRAKKLRYAVEFFRPLFGRKLAKQQVLALARLQDCLGALNDAAVGAALVEDVAGGGDEDVAAAAIAAGSPPASTSSWPSCRRPGKPMPRRNPSGAPPCRRPTRPEYIHPSPPGVSRRSMGGTGQSGPAQQVRG